MSFNLDELKKEIGKKSVVENTAKKIVESKPPSNKANTKNNQPTRRRTVNTEARQSLQETLQEIKKKTSNPKTELAPNQEYLTLSNGQNVVIQRGASAPQTVDWNKVNDSTFGKVYTGVGTGLVNAFTGLPSAIASGVTGKDIDVSEKLGLSLKNDTAFQKSGIKDTAAFKGGELGGELLGYVIQSGLANPITSKAGDAVAKSKLGKDIATNAVDAATVGTLQNIGIGYQQGLRGQELAADVLGNTLLDMGVGTGLSLVGAGLGKLADMPKTVDLPTAKSPDKEVVDLPTKQAKTVDFEAKTSYIKPETVAESHKQTYKTYVEATSEKVKKFANKVRNGQVEKGASNNLGSVGERETKDIKNLTGVDVSGYEHSLPANAIGHIDKRHGKVGKQDKSMADDNDLSRIGFVLKNYDTVELARTNTGDVDISFAYRNSDGSPSPKIKYSKRVDGHYYVVEAVPDSATKKLQVVSAYIKKADTMPASSAPSPEHALSKTVPQATSETPVGNSTLNARVAQKDNSVKLKDLGADTLKASDDIETIRKKYGTFEGSRVPLKTKLGDVQQGAKTLYDSKLSTPEVKAAISEGIKDGDYWKNTVTNKSVLEEAEEIVSKNLEEATASFKSIMAEGKQGTSKDIAKGYKLAEAYIEKGDYNMVESIMADVSAMESEAGRTLQAMRIFKNLTSAGKVKSTLRTVEKLSALRGVEIKVNQELLDNIYKATNDAELAAANKAFALDVWNQIPANFSEKMNAWRYLAMLGNPKTHIRNVVGNMIYVPARVISDAIAAGIEKAFKGKIQKISGGDVSGSKAVFKGKYKDLAKDAYKRNKASLDATSSKYFETMRPQEAKVFNLKNVEGARKINSKLLEGEDNLFKELSFKSAYAQYLKANKVTDLTDEIDKAATAYAYSQALRSTYQDPSKLADAISKFKRRLAPQQGDKGLTRLGKTAASQVAEATLPFVRTPINILKRGMEYSPAGLVGGIGKMLSAGSKGNVDEFLKGIELLASGITGTGLVALGMWARHRGLVNGSLGGWNKETAYKQTLGEQDYAITVGDMTFTLDWASPLAMPFFVGVEAINTMDSIDDATFWKVFESMSTITEPAFEMSMLSGVETVFDTSFSDDTSKISTILSNAVQGYASQFIPTFLGQIARTVTADRKANISTAETKTERAVTKYLSKIANKVPGLTELTEPYIDQWGRTDSKHTVGDYVIAAVENFVSPGYISMKNITPVDKEVMRLYELTNDDKVIPYTPSGSVVTVKGTGEQYRLSNEDFTNFKKTAGKYRYKNLEKLFKSSEYKLATNAEKVKMVDAVYDAGYEYAKEKFLVGTGKMTTEQYSYTTLTDLQKKAVDAKETTAVKIRNAQETVKKAGYDGKDNGVTLAMTLSDYDSATKKAYNQKNISDAAISKAERLQKAGVSTEDYYELYLKAKAIGGDQISKAEAQKALKGEGYSGEEYWAIIHALSNAKV